MDKPVFVVGCDRSGTTLLGLLLNQSPDLYMTLESGFIPDLYRKREVYENFSDAKHRWYLIRDLQTARATSRTSAFSIFDLTDDQAENVLSLTAPTDYAGAVSALFRSTAEKNGKARWGNKTPRYVLHLKLLAELFPGAAFIHIIRDPRDVARSIMKAGWTSSLEQAAGMWRKRVGKGIEGRSLGKDRYYELKYESLLSNPERVLKQLYDWLDIEYPGDVLESYREDGYRVKKEHRELHKLVGKPIDKSRAFAWKRTMSKADIAEVEHLNRTLIRELNYEESKLSVPVTRRLKRASHNLFVPVGKKIVGSVFTD